MSGEIRPRNKRIAFYRSQSSSRADDVKDTSYYHCCSCQGGMSSENVFTNDQSEKGLKEDIMQLIEQKVSQPIIYILQEVDELKKVINKKCIHCLNSTEPEARDRNLRAKYEGVRAECGTSVCNATEPKCMLQGHMESEPVYRDMCKSKQSNFQRESIHNQMYRCVESSVGMNPFCINSNGVHKQGQQNGYDNEIVTATKPTEFRSNSLHTRVQNVTVQPRPLSVFHLKIAPYDERECLANALQFHIEDLVDGLVFHESELPDGLLADGCLTEDECATVRRLPDRKDQIRILLSLIKGRDLRVLKGFLKHIEQHNPDVARKITNKFENNKHDGLRGKLCVLCKLMKQFNVKHVADSLWAIEVINDELYNRIVYSQAPVGAQIELWKEVIDTLNSLHEKNAVKAHNKLLCALKGKNLFTHLAGGIDDMLIKNHGMLTCACEPKFILPTRSSFLRGTTSGESFFPDSSSDSASNDVTSCDGTEHLDSLDGRIVDTKNGMSQITEVMEEPISPSSNATVVTNKDEISRHEYDNVSFVSRQPTLSHRINGEPINDSSTAQMTYLKNSKTQKKPVPAPKPPVPSKKPEIVANISKISTETLLSSNIASVRIVTSDVPSRGNRRSDLSTMNVREIEEDKIPPLPEKKNKYLAPTTKTCDQ